MENISSNFIFHILVHFLQKFQRFWPFFFLPQRFDFTIQDKLKFLNVKIKRNSIPNSQSDIIWTVQST